MKKIFLTLSTVLLLAFALAASVHAQEETGTARQELINLVGEAIVEETTQRSEEVRKAKEILDVVLNDDSATPQQREEAETQVREAEANYAQAQKKLDTARVDAFAEQCGKSPAEIQAMRDSGMGWGRIAKECGVHPSAAGKGNQKSKAKAKNKGKGKKK